MLIRRKPLPASRIALTVTAVFALTGLAWVLLTDILLYELTRDPVLIARIETAKGWAFIALGAALVYAVTLRTAARLARSQATLTAIIESIADGVLLLGSDRVIRRANPAAVRMLGCDDLVGMGAEEFSRRFRVSYLDGSLVPPSQFISQRAFDEGGPLHYKAILHPGVDPELIISATAAAVRLQCDDAPHLVVSVMHDITDSEHFERLRDQFLSAAAHALKTPVAVIKANANLLAVRGAQPHGPVAAIGRQSDRIDLLVQNLLVFARIRSKTLRLYPRELALRPLVERTTCAMAAAFAAHEVRCELEARPKLHADEERLALALRNVLDEALRLAAPASPVTVLLVDEGRDARFGARYRPVAPAEQDASAFQAAEELALQRFVTTTIVESHGGAVRAEKSDAENAVWLRLPVLEKSE